LVYHDRSEKKEKKIRVPFWVNLAPRHSKKCIVYKFDTNWSNRIAGSCGLFFQQLVPGCSAKLTHLKVKLGVLGLVAVEWSS